MRGVYGHLKPTVSDAERIAILLNKSCNLDYLAFWGMVSVRNSPVTIFAVTRLHVDDMILALNSHEPVFSSCLACL